MTAKEMFEELGYELLEVNKKKEYAVYNWYYNSKVVFTISFFKGNDDKYFIRYEDYQGDAINIDIPMLQAINKQIEELGWDND